MADVLVVDDHISMAQAVAAMVRMSHHDAAVVHSGQAALDHIASHHVDLVVLDVSMPGMTGLDVLRELGASGRLVDLPVVMFSASKEYREEARRLGAVEFVLKHEADELPTLIDRYTSAKKQTHHLHA